MIHESRSRGLPRVRLFGTCAAIGDRTGINPNVVRGIAIAALLLVSWKLTLAAYCLTALALRYARR